MRPVGFDTARLVEICLPWLIWEGLSGEIAAVESVEASISNLTS